MLTTTTVSKLRQSLGRHVARVSHGGDRVLILKHGIAAAALVPVSDFEVLEEAERKSLRYKEYQMAEKLAKWEAIKREIARERE